MLDEIEIRMKSDVFSECKYSIIFYNVSQKRFILQMNLVKLT